MRPRDLLLLLLLGGIWGASFLFIKVAVMELSPIALVTARLSLGACGLLVIVRLFGGRQAHGRDKQVPNSAEGPLRSAWKGRPLWVRAVVLGFFGAIVPWLLIAWGELHISSGAAAILNATSPFFSSALGHWGGLWGAEERLSAARGLGLLLGTAGVTLLVVGSEGARSLTPQGVLELLGYLAVVAASASYAVGALYSRLAFSGEDPLTPAAAQNVGGAAVLLPVALAVARPEAWPSAQATGSVLALGFAGTAAAYVIYYRIVARLGATAGLSVTYLLPAFALAYGAVLLGEQIPLPAVGGLFLILAGVALVMRR